MYFKDNGKSEKFVYFGNGYEFNHYEFSKIQQWMEVGQRLQKIFFLQNKLYEILTNLEAEHGPFIKEVHDKVTGYTGGTSIKPVKDFLKEDEIKYISRLIEKCYNKDLKFITNVDRKFRELRPYKNLVESQKMFCENDKAKRELIEKYFDYMILKGLKRNLLDFWDQVRKKLDDKTNEISIPEPTIENREFYGYFLRSRDNYCEGDKEIALGIIRKAVEDILTRLWILSFDNLSDIKFDRRDSMDGLPGILKEKGKLTEQEARDARAFVKHGNAGLHVKGEIPIDKLYENCKLNINKGISFVNGLTKKYVDLMVEKDYCSMEFTKTGFTVGMGDFHQFIANKQAKKDTFHKDDIPEFKEDEN